MVVHQITVVCFVSLTVSDAPKVDARNGRGRDGRRAKPGLESHRFKSGFQILSESLLLLK